MTLEAGLAAGAAAVASCLATGLVGRAARRRGLFDAPEAGRRIHRSPTPRLGGVGLLLGILAGCACMVVAARALPAGSRSEPGGAVDLATPFLVGGALFFVVGLLDDIRRPGLPPIAKMGLQVAAAAVPAAMGARFDGVTSADPWPAMSFGGLSLAMTVLWFVAVANLVNFMDGIDWIAAGTALVVVAGRGLVMAPEGAAALSGPFLACAGAILGFAPWNAPPARIFMGDGGSHLLGFFAAAAACAPGTSYAAPVGSDGSRMTVLSSHALGGGWAMTAAALLPSVVDVAEALLHKARHGIPLAQAHHDHLYQRLVKAGSGSGVVALRYTLLAAAGAVLAGPVAARFGAWAALLPGTAILAAHLWTGARATRAIPRLKAS